MNELFVVQDFWIQIFSNWYTETFESKLFMLNKQQTQQLFSSPLYWFSSWLVHFLFFLALAAYDVATISLPGCQSNRRSKTFKIGTQRVVIVVMLGSSFLTYMYCWVLHSYQLWHCSYINFMKVVSKGRAKKNGPQSWTISQLYELLQ